VSSPLVGEAIAGVSELGDPAEMGECGLERWAVKQISEHATGGSQLHGLVAGDVAYDHAAHASRLHAHVGFDDPRWLDAQLLGR
jgi:hypothetical protein